MPAVTLESEEWYVLGNWLRERENRLMYALRPRSGEWEFVHDLRRTVERQQDGGRETAGAAETVGTAETASEAETTETATKAGAVGAAETAGTTATVRLSNSQVAYLSSFLRKRAQKLLLFPWRSRERRDVRHLRDHLLAEASRSDDATASSTAPGQLRE